MYLNRKRMAKFWKALNESYLTDIEFTFNDIGMHINSEFPVLYPFSSFG